MRQALEFKACAQDCRDLAKRVHDLRFKSLLLELADQIDELAEAREAFLKRLPWPADSAAIRRVQ